MKKHLKLTLALAIAICLCSTSLFAVDGNWSAAAVYPTTLNWADSANWYGGTVAGGSGYTAYFTNGTAAAGGYKTIGLAGQTISHMKFAIEGNDPAGIYILFSGTVNLVGTPTIDVADPANLYAVYAGYPGFGGSLSGTAGFAKTGTGRLIMAQPSSISGPVNISGGEIQVTDNNGLQYATINVGATERLYVGGGVSMNSSNITVQSGGRIYPIGGAAAFTVNGNIIAKGEHAYEGANGDSTNNLNGTITLDSGATAWAGVALADSGVLNINNGIVGSGDLHILGHSASGLVQVINLNCTNDYTGGDTRLASYWSNPRFELNKSQALANDNLTIANNTYLPGGAESVILDLNNNTQEVVVLNMDAGGTPPPGQFVKIMASPAGRIKVSNWAHTFNGKCIIEGGRNEVAPYFDIGAGTELVLTDTYVNATSEFLVWGANATLTINHGAVARNFVTRVPELATVATINLNNGGKLETARIWTATANTANASALNFDGGIISDGAEGEHEGSYMNWFSAGQSNVIKAGGAIVEVNNANGRRILQPFYHDPALGATADGGLTKIGPATLVLAGANNYTGPTVVTNGTLVVSNTVAGSGIEIREWAKYGVPFTHTVNTPITVKDNGMVKFAISGVALSGSKITVEDGASVYCDAAITFTNNNNIDFQGWGHQGGGIEIFNTVANGVYNGTNTVMAAGTRVFSHGAGGTMTFNGPFAGSQEVHLIGQGGDAAHIHTFYLNAKNINTSRTTLRTFAADTTYELGIADCFPTDQQLELLVHNWGTTYCASRLDINTYDQHVASLELNCGAGEDVCEVRGDASATLTVAGNVNQSGGTAEVNTCSLDVGGTLTVNGSLLGMNNVTLLSGASVKGSGILGGALTIPSGAAIAPGNSIGTLNTGNIVMDAGSIYDWELGDTALGEADLVNVNGTLAIGTVANAITVNVLKVSGVTQPGDTMTLYTTSSGVSGNATSIFMDYTSNSGISGPANPTISGNDVVISGITPEPGFIGMIVLGALALLRRKK